MKVVLLGTEFAMNGAAVLLYRWAMHLVQRGHTVSAVPASQKVTATGPLRDAYVTAGVTIEDKLYVDPQTLVICNTIAAAPYVIQTAPNARTIWWLHEGEVGLELLFANPSAARAFRVAHAVIFPSAVIRDQVYASYLLGVPKQRLHVVPPGLEPLRQQATEPEPEQEKEKRPLRVACVGSVYPRKRQADLIRAVALLRNLSIECLLVGQMVSLDDEAAGIARKSPKRFNFTGQLPHEETMRLLDRADVLALPSSSECLPIAPLEAGQRGKAILLSDLPAHEGIWRHGVNCLMHPVGDVTLMAHSLRILASDRPLRERLGAQARRAAAPFRNDIFLARLGLVIASLA
jgi:glycosyltransferase involved in cell wall biosynthesis